MPHTCVNLIITLVLWLDIMYLCIEEKRYKQSITQNNAELCPFDS